MTTTYQVILATDGKHTVIFTTDEVRMTENALVWAKDTYDRLVKRYGLKHEQYHKNGDQNGNGEEAVPACEVHNVPMVRQQGKYGSFWSCHQRNADKSFCSYRSKED